MISDSQMPSIPRLTREIYESIAAELGRPQNKIYVVYSKSHNSVLFDPMTRKPVHAKDPRMLETIAKEFSGVVVTLREAFNLITKHSTK